MQPKVISLAVKKLSVEGLSLHISGSDLYEQGSFGSMLSKTIFSV
jgi:hypothetical protein